MAKFDASQTTVSAPQNAVTPQQPVTTPAVGVKAAASLFDKIGNIGKAVNKSGQQATLASFEKKQLGIIQALDQGKIKSSAFARTLLRKNLIQTINDYPALSQDILKSNASVLGNAGMGQQVTSGTQQELQTQKLKAHLIQNGLLDPNATDSEFRKAATNFQLAQEEQRRYQQTMDTIALEKAKTDLTSSQRKALDAKASSAAVDYFNHTAPVVMDHFMGFVKKVRESDLSTAEKVQAINRRWAEFQQQMAPYAAQVSGHQADAYTKAFELTKNEVIGEITGKISSDAAAAQIAKINNENTLQALKDPTIAKAYAASSMFRNNMPIDQIPSIQQHLSSFINTNLDNSPDAKTADLFTTDPTARKAVKDYLNIVGKGDVTDPNQLAEQGQHLKNILAGVEDYSSLMKKNPKSAVELVNWFASPDFLKLRKEHPELLSNMSTVKDIVQSNYADKVWGLVRKEFINNQVVAPTVTAHGLNYNPLVQGQNYTMDINAQKTTSLVKAEPSSDGVNFVPIDPSNQQAVKKAEELNTNLKPVINTTVRAVAHLSGSTDYKSTYEQAATLLMEHKFPENPAGQPSDFKEPASNQSSQLQDLIDKKEGGGGYDTLFGNAQQQGKEFAGVDVSNMTVGQAIDFAKGQYADWSKKKLGYVATPMGRYQIVGSTLADAAKNLKLAPDTPFNAQTQDQIFHYLVGRALKGKKTEEAKREALRNTWAGFKNVSNAELDSAIQQYEKG